MTATKQRKANAPVESADKAPASDLVAMKVSRNSRGHMQVEMASTGYDIASGDRSFRPRPIRFEGADRHLDYSSRRKLVSVGRDMDRNSLLSAMLDRWVDGVVGSMLNFRPTTGDKGWNKAAHELVRERMASCDHRGFFDAPTLTRIMLRALGTDGEQLWTMTDDDKIQVIETHQLGTPRDKLSGNANIVDGIEIEKDGRVKGYWVSDEVYGGFVRRSTHANWVDGRDAIMPAFRKRSSQTHGVPLVGTGLKLHDRVDGYLDNEALASEIDACLTFFVKKKKQDQPTTPPFPGAGGRRTETTSEGAAKILQKIEPGMIARIGADEEVDQFGAKRPGTQFTQFVETGLTLVGATIGVPLPLALLDFKKLNYSNARTLLLQMWQTWQIWHRSTVVPCWQWAYNRWVLREIAQSATLKARDDAFSAKWLPRRWPWVDPLREVQAVHDEIALGIGTITDQLELLGYTLDEYLDERSHELAEFAARRVPTTSIMTTGNPVPPPPGDGGNAEVDGPGTGGDQETGEEYQP